MRQRPLSYRQEPKTASPSWATVCQPLSPPMANVQFSPPGNETSMSKPRFLHCAAKADGSTATITISTFKMVNPKLISPPSTKMSGTKSLLKSSTIIWERVVPASIVWAKPNCQSPSPKMIPNSPSTPKLTAMSTKPSKLKSAQVKPVGFSGMMELAIMVCNDPSPIFSR